MKVLHTWGINNCNTGDLILNFATKDWFNKNIGKAKFDNKSCRDLYSSDFVDKINDCYDALLIGGGGLILPDTNPNKTSCWQWNISKENIQKIKIPIYVVSIGYNLFYEQTICMPNREDGYADPSRLQIFNKNIQTLIRKSEYFSLRHKGDIELIKNHVSSELHDKIKFQFCPTIEYVKQKKQPKSNGGILALEMKEDRTWRRYNKTSKKKVFDDIVKFFKKIKDKQEIAVLLHEPNNIAILQHLRSRGVSPRVIHNYNIPEKQVIKNFQSIDKLYCMAGHSQMMGDALGCSVKSIITHNKLKFFLEDTNQYLYENYIDPNAEDVYEKLMVTYEY